MSKKPAKKKPPVLGKSVQSLIEEQLGLFREKFGRDPRRGEPLFFDPAAAVPRRLQLEPMEADIVKLMRQAKVHPRLIYAFEKTGRLLTESNRKNLSKADLAEWDAALAEYDRISRR